IITIAICMCPQDRPVGPFDHLENATAPVGRCLARQVRRCAVLPLATRQTGVVASFRTITETLLISAGRRFGAQRELNARIVRGPSGCQMLFAFATGHWYIVRKFLSLNRRGC